MEGDWRVFVVGMVTGGFLVLMTILAELRFNEWRKRKR